MLHLRVLQNSPLWHHLRNQCKATHVSASEAAAVLNLSQYKTRTNLFKSRALLIKSWQSSQKTKTFQSQFQTDAMTHGLQYEKEAIELAIRIVDPFNLMNWMNPGIVISNKFKLSCSPDIMFCHPKVPNKIYGLEAKCPYSKPLPNSIKHLQSDHVLQSFFSIYCTNAQYWILFYYEASTKAHRMYRIKRCQPLFERLYCGFVPGQPMREEDTILEFLIRVEKNASYPKEPPRRKLKENWIEIMEKYDFIEDLNFKKK